jgi:negative regulator of sigma E activity
MDNDNLKRIADALEEILRLVKKDMERYEKTKD